MVCAIRWGEKRKEIKGEQGIDHEIEDKVFKEIFDQTVFFFFHTYPAWKI